jgi:HTH-type transcriptional regulator / antitoxin HigA
VNMKRTDVSTAFEAEPTYMIPYLRLVSAFPLRLLRDDEDLDAAIEVLNSLSGRADLTEAERDYMHILGGIVEEYEAEHIVIPEVGGVELLRFLMEENGLTQASLTPIFGGKSNISEVLSGKRELSKAQIRGLSERFGLPADAFM